MGLSSDQAETKNESIGGLDAMTILGFVFSTKENGFSIFDGQSIVDVGAGFSPLLKIIGQNAIPATLTAVDPIYSGGENSAIEYTKNSIKKFLSAIMRDPNWQSNALLREFDIGARRQLVDTENYSRQLNIRYIGNVSELPKDNPQDIIFVSSLLYSMEEPKLFLEALDSKLKSNGVIIITDFMARGNIHGEIVRANIAITQINRQYF